MKERTGCAHAKWKEVLGPNDISEDDEDNNGGVRVAVSEEEAIVELRFHKEGLSVEPEWGGDGPYR